MPSRGKFLTAALLVCALLLGITWLAELPPFAPSQDPGADVVHAAITSRRPDAPIAGSGEEGQDTADTPDDAPAHETAVQPGLKSTAPVMPPQDAPPPPVPERPTPPVRPQAIVPGARFGVDAAKAVPLELQVSGKAVTKALDTAVAWLRKKQARDGSWGTLHDLSAYTQFHNAEPVTQRAGPTALALYTLLRANASLRDPVVRKAFDFLRKHHAQPATSMESAMVLLAVLETAEGSKRRKTDKPRLRGVYRNWASKLVDHLVEKRSARGWRYNVTGRVEPLRTGGPEDLVSTHLATLALFSAYRLGIKTKDRVWEEILRYTLDQQEGATLHRPDPRKPRGFAYILGHPASDAGEATGGTTACGIALLRMTTHVLSAEGTQPLRLKERDEVLYDTAAASLPAAYAWLVEHWSPYANPGKKPAAKVLHHHWLWALETAQDLHHAPSKVIGEHVWYLRIGEQLINRQHKDGHWRVLGSWEPSDVLDTCFAILFLKRATRGLIPSR